MHCERPRNCQHRLPNALAALVLFFASITVLTSAGAVEPQSNAERLERK